MIAVLLDMLENVLELKTDHLHAPKATVQHQHPLQAVLQLTVWLLLPLLVFWLCFCKYFYEYLTIKKKRTKDFSPKKISRKLSKIRSHIGSIINYQIIYKIIKLKQQCSHEPVHVCVHTVDSSECTVQY